MSGYGFVPAGGLPLASEYTSPVERFCNELKLRGVCSVSRASNSKEWFAGIMHADILMEAYLQLVDCRENGGKMLHADALQILKTLKAQPELQTRFDHYCESGQRPEEALQQSILEHKADISHPFSV